MKHIKQYASIYRKLDNYWLKIVFIFFWFVSCNIKTKEPQSQMAELHNATKSEYKWTELTANANFRKSYNFQLFSIRDTIWAMHHDGTWFSLDGINWTKSPLTNILKDNAFLDYIWFKNSLYSIGTFEGNVEHYKFTTAISRTSNMKTWESLAAISNLPRRFFYHPFVFKNKIWIIGGNDGSDNFDDSSNYSDIWNSVDGVKWIKQADNLPFGKRSQSQFVLFKNKIFMLNNDVWVSDDGLKWKKVVERIANENIFGYASIVFDGQIWLIGCNRNGVFQSQVLVSNDGEKWISKPAPWSPRGGAAVCIHKGKIFMTGGKYGGFTKNGHTVEFVYSNDVWTMAKR